MPLVTGDTNSDELDDDEEEMIEPEPEEEEEQAIPRRTSARGRARVRGRGRGRARGSGRGGARTHRRQRQSSPGADGELTLEIEYQFEGDSVKFGTILEVSRSVGQLTRKGVSVTEIADAISEDYGRACEPQNLRFKEVFNPIAMKREVTQPMTTADRPFKRVRDQDVKVFFFNSTRTTSLYPRHVLAYPTDTSDDFTGIVEVLVTDSGAIHPHKIDIDAAEKDMLDVINDKEVKIHAATHRSIVSMQSDADRRRHLHTNERDRERRRRKDRHEEQFRFDQGEAAALRVERDYVGVVGHEDRAEMSRVSRTDSYTDSYPTSSRHSSPIYSGSSRYSAPTYSSSSSSSSSSSGSRKRGFSSMLSSSSSNHRDGTVHNVLRAMQLLKAAFKNPSEIEKCSEAKFKVMVGGYQKTTVSNYQKLVKWLFLRDLKITTDQLSQQLRVFLIQLKHPDIKDCSSTREMYYVFGSKTDHLAFTYEMLEFVAPVGSRF